MLRCSSFFFCCRWVDGVAMLSVVKRNILKGRPPPHLYCVEEGGAESGGMENKKEEKYIKESDVLALFSQVLFTHTHPH